MPKEHRIRVYIHLVHSTALVCKNLYLHVAISSKPRRNGSPTSISSRCVSTNVILTSRRGRYCNIWATYM